MIIFRFVSSLLATEPTDNQTVETDALFEESKQRTVACLQTLDKYISTIHELQKKHRDQVQDVQKAASVIHKKLDELKDCDLSERIDKLQKELLLVSTRLLQMNLELLAMRPEQERRLKLLSQAERCFANEGIKY